MSSKNKSKNKNRYKLYSNWTLYHDSVCLYNSFCDFNNSVNREQVYIFNTVENFWRLYNNILEPSNMDLYSTYIYSSSSTLETSTPIPFADLKKLSKQNTCDSINDLYLLYAKNLKKKDINKMWLNIILNFISAQIYIGPNINIILTKFKSFYRFALVKSNGNGPENISINIQDIEKIFVP
jgi:hypothetical protein